MIGAGGLQALPWQNGWRFMDRDELGRLSLRVGVWIEGELSSEDGTEDVIVGACGGV